jgi:outer membrane lipoprotein SlyB
MKNIAMAILAASLLSACAHPGQDRYGYQDVGKATKVAFGTVVTRRPVLIEGKNTGTGALVGAAGGALGGSYIGNGGGSIGGLIAGALIAGVAGHMAEQAIQNYDGVEFTVTLENEDTITVTQTAEPALEKIKDGDRVMVQTSGDYMRVLPAEHLPTKVKKAKRIRVGD